MRAKASTTAPLRASAPPLRPVPAPRGTIGNPFSPASRTMPATCSVVCGKTTARGAEVWMPPSYSYSIRSSARSRTASEPAIFLSWRTNEEKRMDIGEFIAGRTNYSKTKRRASKHCHPERTSKERIEQVEHRIAGVNQQHVIPQNYALQLARKR